MRPAIFLAVAHLGFVVFASPAFTQTIEDQKTVDANGRIDALIVEVSKLRNEVKSLKDQLARSSQRQSPVESVVFPDVISQLADEDSERYAKISLTLLVDAGDVQDTQLALEQRMNDIKAQIQEHLNGKTAAAIRGPNLKTLKKEINDLIASQLETSCIVVLEKIMIQ